MFHFESVYVIHFISLLAREESHLYAFSVLFVEGANVKGVSCVDLATRRYQRRCVFLYVHLLPVQSREERMFLHLISPAPSMQT